MVQCSKRKKKKTPKKKTPVNVRPSATSKLSIKNVRSLNSTVASSSSSSQPFDSDDAHLLFPPNFIEEQISIGDFHLHSVCSDGKLRPSAVVEKAHQNGVQYLALTDHDTMAGVEEAMETAKKCGMFLIPGVEISAEAKGAENIHVLGYFAPGTTSIDLQQKLEQIREARHKRGKEMLHKLSKMGIHLEWDKILKIAGEAAPGRPHIAEALVNAGHVPNFREAFNRYLHNDGPCYAEGEHFPPEDAIQLISEIGGISVLAHPWCCKDPMNLIPKLAKAGLHGVEVYHSTSKIDMYGSLAKESSLLMLGGSDFHGINPDTERQPGDIPLPKNKVLNFLEAAKVAWNKAIVQKIHQISRIIANSAKDEVDLCIWTEQLDVVKRTANSLQLDVEILGQGLDSHYRSVKVSKLPVDC